ncbi:hypothetical protein EDB92DRAFT_1866613 [Lactarius akahatsu]|uniref:Uncharacterized protein n=1 Tax=Lactarius akahatsu TaxID=416441 RepID=A0AAD4LFN5_9AGAM|nr:hypothetical protein EDB92DRAFT_1866613 [Lactarius akahatsu]
MADNLNAPRPTSASETEPDSNPSSTSASLISPTSSARPPVLRARPRLPAGPRTRKQTTLVPSKEDHNEDHTPPLQLPPAWTPTEHGSDGQLTNPSSPTPVPLLSTPQPVNSPPPAPPAPHQPDPFSPPPHNHQHLHDHDVSTSRPGTPTPLAALSPSPIISASRKPSHATVNSATAPPLTLPAAQLNLTPEPLPYKHLTLDAAHWTLTSTELQSLVSSAIRESAKEQFIRLLPQSAIETNIPEDVTRIERSWDTAAARWRFEAHRRNMLLRALAASGADSDLLTQLSGTLGTLDSHAQDLLHAAAHRTQIAAARDTHRASALAVALRKLNASYARRTRDLDKARANINALRSEVEEAWKVAEEQAAEVDKLKAEATSAATQLRHINDNTSSRAAELSTDDDNALEDDASSAALDGASVDLTTISRAQVVDVTGKAVAAQARLTMMRSNLSSPSPGRTPPVAGSSSSTPRSAVPPPSAFAVPREPSPTTPASDTLPLPSSASQVSRVSAARRRSTRKSKASLRLPATIAVGAGTVVRSRSRSVVRGEANAVRKAARSKSRSRKGKERDRAAPPPPWLSADVAGSFLEMEGRPAGEEDAYADGEVDTDDGEGSTPLGSKPRTAITPVFSPPLLASGPASAPPAQAHMPRATNGSSSSSSTQGTVPLSSTPGQREGARGPSSPSPILPSISSTPTLPPSEDSHAYAAAAPADFIPDPASIFASATTTSLSMTTISTATTAASALDIARRGHSLDLPSSTTSTGKHHHRHATGAKIRRSISELLNFGSSGTRSRRRSLPFTFKGRSSTRAALGTEHGSGSGVGSSALRRNLDLNDGSEDGWEDTREDEGSTAAAVA